MEIGSIDFGPNGVFLAPGTRGFFGEGYWFHPLLQRLGVDFETPVFTSKTVTYKHNQGNMAIDTKGQPAERFPKCIKVWPWSGHTVNAVGLANHGAKWLFTRRELRALERPFLLSFMPKGKNATERLEQTKGFTRLLKKWQQLYGVSHRFGLQLNVACPNAHIDPAELYQEVGALLEVLLELGIPIILNLNALTPVEVLMSAEPLVDVYWIANTIPWGATDKINWKKLTKDGRSPLPKQLGDVDITKDKAVQEMQYQDSFKKGGLSGPMCLPLTLDLVRQARIAGITKPIIAGNGVQSAADVVRVWLSGANGVAIGTVYNVRPWLVNAIIAQAKRIGPLWDDPRYAEREEMYSLLSTCGQMLPVGNPST